MQLIDSEQCELPFRPASRSPPKSRIGRPAYTKRGFNTQPLSPASLSTSRSLPMLATEPFNLSGAGATAELPALPAAEPEPAAPAVKSKPQIRVQPPNASTLRLPSVRVWRAFVRPPRARARARARAARRGVFVDVASRAPGPDRAVVPHEPTDPQRDVLFADGLDDEGGVPVPRELGL